MVESATKPITDAAGKLVTSETPQAVVAQIAQGGLNLSSLVEETPDSSSPLSKESTTNGCPSASSDQDVESTDTELSPTEEASTSSPNNSGGGGGGEEVKVEETKKEANGRINSVYDPDYNPKGFEDWLVHDSGARLDTKTRMREMVELGVPIREVRSLFRAGGNGAVEKLHNYLLSPSALRSSLLTGANASDSLKARWNREFQTYQKEVKNRKFSTAPGSASSNSLAQSFALQYAINLGYKQALNRSQRRNFNELSGNALDQRENVVRKATGNNNIPTYGKYTGNDRDMDFWKRI